MPCCVNGKCKSGFCVGYLTVKWNVRTQASSVPDTRDCSCSSVRSIVRKLSSLSTLNELAGSWCFGFVIHFEIALDNDAKSFDTICYSPRYLALIKIFEYSCRLVYYHAISNCQWMASSLLFSIETPWSHSFCNPRHNHQNGGDAGPEKPSRLKI